MTTVLPLRTASFGDVIAHHHDQGRLVVQPRMGFSDPVRMRQGLIATRQANAVTVGTITLDSYTRLGDRRAVQEAIAARAELNGYPIVDQDAAITAAVLDGAVTPGFPVQVRHGSADARRIIRAMVQYGLSATEGGPVSYCLPYSRMPLREAVDNWRRCCELLAQARGPSQEPHLETFGGCMMGQLCPPAMLVALSLLEGMFFAQHGLRCISLSYAQQTHPEQDEEAVAALRALIDEYLPQPRTHLVIYTYMGVYPRTPGGASRLLASSARLAVRAGASRLIVKTTAEAYRLPTIAENVAALEHAAAVAGTEPGPVAAPDTGIAAQARALVGNVLSLDDDIGRALRAAFASGQLDVPFCLHPDNPGRARGFVDRDGRLQWQQIGGLPLGDLVRPAGTGRVSSADLLASLQFMQHKFDRTAAGGVDAAAGHRPLLPHEGSMP